MTINVAFEESKLAVLRASGVLLRDEVDAAKRQVYDRMQAHGPHSALMVVEDGFLNLEAFASWDDIEVDPYLQQHIVRLAVVSNLRWRDSAMLFFMSAVARFEMRHFKPEQEELARAWLVA